jgi:excisionase family DNA binding protein
MNKTISFFTPAQIANELQISILTVYNYIHTHKIKAVKLGRTYRVAKKDFENFIKESQLG